MKLPKGHNQIVDYEKIKTEAFVLMNLGYGFLRLMDDYEGDVQARSEASIFQNYGDIYSKEVSSLLISISISGRLLDDILIRTGRGITASKWEYEEMLGDDEDGKHLSLRECFNKVIHAEKIDYELMQLPELYLDGKRQNGKEWYVRLFIFPFCVSVFEWVNANQA